MSPTQQNQGVSCISQVSDVVKKGKKRKNWQRRKGIEVKAKARKEQNEKEIKNREKERGRKSERENERE